MLSDDLKILSNELKMLSDNLKMLSDLLEHDFFVLEFGLLSIV